MPPRKKYSPILGGRARLYAPSTPGGRWQVVWRDPVTGKPKNRTGATKDIVVQKAAEALGDWVDDPTGVAPPTVGEAVETWITDNQHRWVSRTTTAYRYRAKALSSLWDLPVTAVRPEDLRRLADGLSRDQAKRVRTIVRATFDSVERWTGRPGDRYSDAIRLPGNASEDAPREVERTQIPTSEWVSGVIDTCYSTCQLHPALSRPGEHVDPVTGEHTGNVLTDDPGSLWFVREKLQLGAPLSLISSMRRGIPDHYKNPIGRRTVETAELASRFRQIALLTALGAAGGLRIGEALALRTRHLFGLHLDQNTARNLEETMHGVLLREVNDGYTPTPLEGMNPLLMRGYRGAVDVVEQVSPDGGRMAVTAPKMGKTRRIYLSPLLYPAWDRDAQRPLRDLLADPHNGILRSAEFDVFDATAREGSLWDMTEVDALLLWKSGFTPIAYLLHDRLREMWIESGRDVRVFWDALLFPTRNPARNRGPGVAFPARRPYATQIPHGTYQSPTNLTGRYVSPLYDYVSDVLHVWPGYKGTTRRGWSHHHLRHYAVSQWLSRGVPVPLVTQQAGHANEAFTLSRYGWAATDSLPDKGFEP